MAQTETEGCGIKGGSGSGWRALLWREEHPGITRRLQPLGLALGFYIAAPAAIAPSSANTHRDPVPDLVSEGWEAVVG